MCKAQTDNSRPGEKPRTQVSQKSPVINKIKHFYGQLSLSHAENAIDRLNHIQRCIQINMCTADRNSVKPLGLQCSMLIVTLDQKTCLQKPQVTTNNKHEQSHTTPIHSYICYNLVSTFHKTVCRWYCPRCVGTFLGAILSLTKPTPRQLIPEFNKFTLITYKMLIILNFLHSDVNQYFTGSYHQRDGLLGAQIILGN